MYFFLKIIEICDGDFASYHFKYGLCDNRPNIPVECAWSVLPRSGLDRVKAITLKNVFKMYGEKDMKLGIYFGCIISTCIQKPVYQTITIP